MPAGAIDEGIVYKTKLNYALLSEYICRCNGRGIGTNFVGGFLKSGCSGFVATCSVLVLENDDKFRVHSSRLFLFSLLSDEAASSQSCDIDSPTSSEEEWFSATDGSSSPEDLRVSLSQ